MASEQDACADDVRAIGADDLAARQRLWTSVDSPWASTADPVRFETTITPIADFAPSTLLSTHLPPALGRTDELLATVRAAPGLDPFVGPDQLALEAILRQFEPVS